MLLIPNQQIKQLSPLLFGITFHALFINQGLGLNLAITGLLLLAGLFYFHKPKIEKINWLLPAFWLVSLFALFQFAGRFGKYVLLAFVFHYSWNANYRLASKYIQIRLNTS